MRIATVLSSAEPQPGCVSNSHAWKGKANTKGIDVLPLHAMLFRVQWQQKIFFWGGSSRVLATAWYKLKASTLKASKREAFQIFAIILPTDDVCLYSVFHSAWEGESALASFDFPVHLHYSCSANLPDFISLTEHILFHWNAQLLQAHCSALPLKSNRKMSRKSAQFSFLFLEINEAMGPNSSDLKVACEQKVMIIFGVYNKIIILFGTEGERDFLLD